MYDLDVRLHAMSLVAEGRSLNSVSTSTGISRAALRDAAIRAVRPGGAVCRVRRQGCVQVTSWSKQWPLAFPRHGPGKKHERVIALEPWQREIVDAHPWEFIRGLYCEALDRVGVEWKPTRRGDRPYNVSVARREAAALMDRFVGSKW